MSAKESQSADFFAGDTKRMRFKIEGAPGVPALLAAPVAYWKMAATLDGAPLIEKNSPSSGVSLVQETISGALWWVAYVLFLEADTATVPADTYEWQLRVVDGAEKHITATGQLTIKERIEAIV